MQKQFITPNAQMRNKFLPSESSRLDQTYTQYLQLLKSQGLWVNQKCFPSFFRLRNGLQYPGVATKQQINPNEVFVRVPKKLVLTSFKASQRQQLQQVFKQQFYHEDWAWQDRVLNTYLLYIYGKKQTQNIWYHMVQHLSKDIDIIGFWPQEDLQKFTDLTVISAAELDRQTFDQQWSHFQKIKQKHEVLQHPVFTKQNYRWIFIHLASRCFGKQLQFTSMVPFCQFFNHHAVDGHYDIEKPSLNTQNNSQQKKQQETANNQQTKSITTEGSYLSEQYIEIGQFAYDELEYKPFTWTCKERLDLDEKEKKFIIELKNNILAFIQQQLRWDDFTILFVPHFIQRCNLLETQYKAGRRNYENALRQLKQIEQSVHYYRDNLVQSLKRWRGKNFTKYIQGKKQTKKQQPVQTQNNQQKPKKQGIIEQFPKQQKNQYQNFILTSGQKDKFMPNNQVYFCYGRNSNRTLLLRYGFAIEGNKYQHMWLSFDIVNTLIHFPDTLSKLEDKQLSLRRKFKLKVNRLNMDLIMFFRLNSWSYFSKASVQQLFNPKNYGQQIAILIQIKESIQFRIPQFEGFQDLTDPKLGYHEYFVNVYHKQKYNILKQHVGFMISLIGFLKSLERGVDVQKAKDQFNPQEKYIFRHYLGQF